jgi:hypothetical protein
MGGQACILYGAAEFSRDIDFAILSDSDNLDRLRLALAELEAQRIAVPPFEARYLEQGHAVHFRCHHPEASGLRIDLMSRLRGVDAFPALWSRRATFELPALGPVEVLSLPDLVASKKTQRDKDWVMLRKLMEASFLQGRRAASTEEELIVLWLAELRTPELLVDCVRLHPGAAKRVAGSRAATAAAVAGDLAQVAFALAEEELDERKRDREYWAPLRIELEALRRDRRVEQ